MGTWPRSPPPHPCGPRSLTGERGAERAPGGPACRLPPPWTPVLSRPPPPTPGTTSTCPTWSKSPASTSRAGGPTSAAACTTPTSWTTLQTSWSAPGLSGGEGCGGEGRPLHHTGQCAQKLAMKGQGVGGRHWSGPSRPSVIVPAPRAPKWAKGLRATRSGVWHSWPSQSWGSLKAAGVPLCLWPAPPPPSADSAHPCECTRTTGSEPQSGFFPSGTEDPRGSKAEPGKLGVS